MTMRQSFEVTDRVPTVIKPYVQAMMRASGLNEFDAVTSVLFAIATHLDLEQYPILVYLGVAGSGKSSAMRQLFPMCKRARWIHGRTLPAHRNVLKEEVRTAFVDEGDMVNTQELIDIYTCRYARQTATVQVNAPTVRGWELRTYNILGATVMHRRVTLNDVGLRSRSIIVRTLYRPLGDYGHISIGDVSEIAGQVRVGVRRYLSEIGEVDRVFQTWSPLIAISRELEMTDWGNESTEVQVRESEVLAGGQGYEPSEAILHALDILARDDISHARTDESVRVSDVVRVVRDEFALQLRPSQIKEEAQAQGFVAGILHGYLVIRVSRDLLDSLLPE